MHSVLYFNQVNSWDFFFKFPKKSYKLEACIIGGYWWLLQSKFMEFLHYWRQFWTTHNIDDLKFGYIVKTKLGNKLKVEK